MAMNEITIPVPVAAEVATLNRRYHWAQEMKIKKAWRETSHYAALATGRTPAKRNLPGRWLVEVSYPVRSLKVKRDPHNWIRTTKWIIDGFVDAGLWPDDNSDYVVVVDARFHLAKEDPDVIVRLEQMPSTSRSTRE